MLKFYIDFKSPAAYLAMKPTLLLIEKYGLAVTWRPYKTVQHAVPPRRSTDQKPEIHRRVRAIARRDAHLLYAGVQGIPMTFPQPPGETDLALAALTLIDSSPTAYVQAAFTAYWADGVNLNDHAVVSRLLEQTGYDASLLTDLDVEAILAQAQETALADGVVDTPAYVIDEQVFIGREHLPWVEELILEATERDRA